MNYKNVVCPFCKTEYKIPEAETDIECVVCGKIWKENKYSSAISKKSTLNLYKYVIYTMLIILIFLFIYVKYIDGKQINSNNLIIKLSESTFIPQLDGSFKINLSGNIINNTNYTKPIPTIYVTLFNESGEIVDVKSVIPPTTLLDAKHETFFNYLITPSNDSVIKAELSFEQKDKNDL